MPFFFTFPFYFLAQPFFPLLQRSCQFSLSPSFCPLFFQLGASVLPKIRPSQVIFTLSRRTHSPLTWPGSLSWVLLQFGSKRENQEDVSRWQQGWRLLFKMAFVIFSGGAKT